MHNATTKSELKKMELSEEPPAVQIYIFLLEMNPNIFNCFRKISELMPNLGLEMLFMLHEASQRRSSGSLN